MAKIGKIIVVLGLVAVLGFYLYRQVSRISIGGTSARVHKLNADGVELRIVLSVVNEGNVAIDVQTFLGQLFYKGSSLGIVQQIQPVSIPATSVGYVEFRTTVGWTSLGLNAYNIFQIYQNNQDSTKTTPDTALIDWAGFRLKGTLRAENISIPVETTIFV